MFIYLQKYISFCHHPTTNTIIAILSPPTWYDNHHCNYFNYLFDMSTVKAKARCPSFFIRSTVSLFPALWWWFRLLWSRWCSWWWPWWWWWWNVDYCLLTVLMSHVTTIAPSRANLHRNHQRQHHNCCHDQKQDQHDNDHCHLWHISLPMPEPPPVTRTTCPLMSLWNTCTANCDLWLVKFLERTSS